MARGRMIAKALSTSERFASLQTVAGKLAEFCQSLYPLMVAHSDDFGRLQGDPFTVKHLVHPTSPRGLDDFVRALTALHQVGLVIWYEAEQRKVIQINIFEKHQPGLHKRTKSDFPEPPGSSGKFPEIPSEEKGTEENRTEGKDAGASAFVSAWNENTTEPLPRGTLTSQRRSKIDTRLKEHDLAWWSAVFGRVEASTFCRGVNDRKWLADLDWLIRNDTNAVKVAEGKYDNRDGLSGSDVTPMEFARAEKLRQACWGRCPHDPHCEDYAACITAIAQDTRTPQGAA